MSNWSSLRDRIDPLLKELQPVAQRVALMVCFTYYLPFDNDLNVEIAEERSRAERGSRALRKLGCGLKRLRAEVESALCSEITVLNDEVRSAHIPYGSPPLLPLPDDSGLTAYFRRKNLPDPADTLHDAVCFRRMLKKRVTEAIENRVFDLTLRLQFF